MMASKSASQLVKTVLPRSQHIVLGSATRSLVSTAGAQSEHGGSSRDRKVFKYGAAAGAVGAAMLIGGSEVFANEDHLGPPPMPWNHHGFFSGFDASSIRRGHQVFAQVCASCHGLKLVAWRTLIDVAYTEQEVKDMASEMEYPDDPGEDGEERTREGKPSDYIKGPYANEQQARYANGGALPPDLSIITKARPHGEDYVFSLLTGYRTEPPEGIVLREGLHYNPYFPGGAIGMAKQLHDGAVEYFDGTPSSASQMAKDVTTFLSWCAEPELNERHKQGVKWICALGIAAIGAGYFKRFRWMAVKSRKVEYKPF
jgi:ubiquinol-cytochrome c reductase cytochrome c1 subunit